MKYTYYAFFNKSKDGGYDISFPDIPGCITCGDDFTDAVCNARDALTIMLINYKKNNKSLPESKFYFEFYGMFITSFDLEEYEKKCQKLNKQVIVINGMGRSGKDSFVKLFQKHYKTINFSSIDTVKEIVSIAGYKGDKTEKDRRFLSDMKRLLGDYNDLPFQSMKEVYDDFMSPSNESEFLFLHIREPEEIKRAVKDFNATTLLIKNSRVNDIISNDSDKNVEDYDYDFTLRNESTIEVLEQKAIEFGRMLRRFYQLL